MSYGELDGVAGVLESQPFSKIATHETRISLPTVQTMPCLFTPVIESKVRESIPPPFESSHGQSCFQLNVIGTGGVGSPHLKPLIHVTSVPPALYTVVETRK